MSKQNKEPEWINSIYENCESVGISKIIIDRFSKYFLKDEDVNGDWFISVNERFEDTGKWFKDLYYTT